MKHDVKNIFIVKMKYVKNGTINKKLTYKKFFYVYSSGSKICYGT